PLSRTSRTASALNSLVNARRFRFAMTHSYRTFVRSGVSTKPGQVQDSVNVDCAAGRPDHGVVGDREGGAPRRRWHSTHAAECPLSRARYRSHAGDQLAGKCREALILLCAERHRALLDADYRPGMSRPAVVEPAKDSPTR